MSALADGGLTPRQQKAVAALLSKPTILAAAKSIGISERTLWGWMQQPAFKRELKLAQKQMFEAAVIGLTRSTTKAIQTLVKNLGTKGEHSVQVRAAKVLLDKAVQVQAMADLQAEVAELRASLERVNGNAAGPESRSGTDPEAGPRSNGPAQPDAGPPAGEPDPPVRGDGLEAGSVADGIPDERGEAGIPPLFATGGEVDDDRGAGDAGSEPSPEE